MDKGLIYNEGYDVVLLRISDLFLVPMFIIVSYFILKSLCKPGKEKLGIYFNLGFALKLMATLAHFFIITYVYQYGDSFGFLRQATALWNNTHSFNDFTTILNNNYEGYDPGLQAQLINDVPATFIMSKYCYVLGYIFNKSYLCISLFGSFFVFFSFWKFFTLLTKIYKGYTKELFFCTLAFPSFLYWTAILLKEQICIFSLGLCIVCYLNWVVLHKRKFVYAVGFFVFGYITFYIKNYIIASMLIAIAVSLYYTFIGTLYARKQFLKLGVVVVMTVLVLFVGISLGQNAIVESTDSLVENVSFMKDLTENIKNDYGEGSYYDLNFEMSLGGIIMVFPKSLFIALFRPFIWEARNLTMLIAALETMIITFLVIKSIFKNGLRFFVKQLFADDFRRFSVVFVITLSVITGMIAFNFGTLARYKTPCLPFYACLIILSFPRKKPNA